MDRSLFVKPNEQPGETSVAYWNTNVLRRDTLSPSFLAVSYPTRKGLGAWKARAQGRKWLLLLWSFREGVTEVECEKDKVS